MYAASLRIMRFLAIASRVPHSFVLSFGLTATLCFLKRSVFLALWTVL